MYLTISTDQMYTHQKVEARYRTTDLNWNNTMSLLYLLINLIFILSKITTKYNLKNSPLGHRKYKNSITTILSIIIIVLTLNIPNIYATKV